MDVLKRVFTSEIKGIDEQEKTLTAYISTSCRDRMDEVLDPLGMDKKNFDKNPVVMWAHDYTQPPIGKALWTKRDGEGVLSKVKFANTEFAQEIFQLYKEGFLKAFSVGFVPKDFKDGDGKKDARRTYTKWELLEYSAVPVPANPEALSLAISKGILKNDDLKKSFEDTIEMKPKPHAGESKDDYMKRCIPKLIDEGKDQDQAVAICSSMFDEKAVDEEVIEKEEAPKETFDEIYAEIKLLTDRVAQLTSENAVLRYKLYQAMQVKETKMPEITGKDYANTVAEVVAGVIRKHQGRLN